MRVLHLDSEAGWRGGQVQLEYLLTTSTSWVCAPREEADGAYSLRGVAEAVRRFRPDVVAAHTARAHQLALGVSLGAPLVVHRRVDFRIRRRARWKYRAADAVVAVSHAVRDIVVEAGVHPARVFVVEDGVEPVRGRPLARPDGPLVLAVGALVPHKGHAHLIVACKEAGVTLWIAGEGPERRALQALAAGGDVVFLGQRSDVPDLLATTDVFAHASVEEGMGQVVLEARAAGCRIVASRAGGVAEAAGPHAWLVAPGDSRALATAIRRSLERPPPRPHLPARFAAQHLVNQTVMAYETVVRGVGR